LQLFVLQHHRFPQKSLPYFVRLFFSETINLNNQFNMAIDLNNDLILVTCASGKQGSALIPQLIGKWKRIRLAVNSTSSEERLKKQYPNLEIVRADMSIAADAKRLIEGVTAVFYVGPSLHINEAGCGYNMIDAAVAESKSGKFQHFIFSSVVGTQLNKLINHDCKRRVEEYLMESGLNYSILKPSHFFENTPFGLLMSQEKPVYPMAYGPNIQMSFTAIRDMGEVAANVFEQREKHYFAEYPIISTMPMKYSDFLDILGKEMGKPIRIEQKPFEDAVDGLVKRFFRDQEVVPQTVDIVERLLLYYTRRGILGNTFTTKCLLGREPTGCEEWARLQVKAFKQG
jgi:uncharacterized protein YbjT (DUF2867 family)